MKNVLISIRPKWCEKILSGEKTIEVRKSVPKEVPFKAFIYCTQYKPVDYINYGYGLTMPAGKVLGEVICDRIDKFNIPYPAFFNEVPKEVKDLIKSAGLTMAEARNYLGRKTGYGWHISDLKIYDKPRELSEFNRPCVTPTKDCERCIRGGTPYNWGFNEKIGKIYCTRRLSKAPQSWQYVEEVEQ